MSSKIMKVLDAISSQNEIKETHNSVSAELNGKEYSVVLTPELTTELDTDSEQRFIGLAVRVLVDGIKVYAYSAGTLQLYNENAIIRRFHQVRNSAFNKKMVADQNKRKEIELHFDEFILGDD